VQERAGLFGEFSRLAAFPTAHTNRAYAYC
jgi:hypothetical protein